MLIFAGESACGISDQTVDAATLCSGVLLIAASQQTLLACLSVHLPKQDSVDLMFLGEGRKATGKQMVCKEELSPSGLREET